MVLSMTGFARVEFTLAKSRYFIEIQTFNRKTLEMTLSAPREFLIIEPWLRQKVGLFLERGQIFIKIFPSQAAPHKMALEVYQQLYQNLQEIAKYLNPQFEVTFREVLEASLKMGGALEFEGEELETTLDPIVTKLLGSLREMRQREGEHLKQDITMRLDSVLKAVHQIEEEGATFREAFQAKMLTKLSEYKEIQEEDRERVLREVILLAEKADVTEEIVRLRSHISQMKSLFQASKEVAIGRTIDFLLQEMMREANTIASKATKGSIINLVIDIKSQIEKIRQQGQNIE